MVDAGDEGLKLHPQQPAQEGHQRLKASEPEPRRQGVSQRHPAGGQPLAHGHREGVHGQPHGQHHQFCHSHGKIPPQTASGLRPGVWHLSRGQACAGAKKRDPSVPLEQISLVMKNKARTPELELSLLTLLRLRADYSLMCRQYDTTGARGLSRKF